jgi:hypothetical protein
VEKALGDAPSKKAKKGCSERACGAVGMRRFCDVISSMAGAPWMLLAMLPYQKLEGHTAFARRL